MTEDFIPEWRDTATFAVVNRRGEIFLYDAVCYRPTVEEPWGNPIERINHGYHRWADLRLGCVAARIDYDTVHYNVNVEGRTDFITVRNYSGGLVLYNKFGRKDYMDLFVFPNNRVLPRGGVPLTLPYVIYKKEDEVLFDHLITKPKEEDETAVVEPIAVPRKRVVKKKTVAEIIEENTVQEDTVQENTIEAQENSLFSDSNVQTFSTSILMSFYFLYYIAMLAFLTEVGDAQIYYGCVMMILGGQWGYVIHTMYEDKRAEFFQGGSKKIETGEVGGE
jgi:hypothetical protein